MLDEICNQETSNKPFLVITSAGFDKFSEYILIFGLTGGGIINVMLLYLGFHGTDLRAKLFIIISVIVFFMACLRLLQIFITLTQYRRSILLALLYPLCAIIIFGAAFAIFGKNAYRSVDMLLQFGCFCIPGFIFGLDCMLNRREPHLFLTLNILSAFYIPIAVLGLYINKVNGTIEAIGDLNYMSVAYILLVPLVFLVIKTVFFRESSFFSKAVSNNTYSSWVPKVICIGLALLYWFVILNTGTRGAYICVLGLFTFLFLWIAYIKQKQFLLRAATLFVLFLMVFSLFMVSPSRATSRTQFFVDGLLHGKFQTSSTQAVSQAELDKITSVPVSTVPQDANINQQDNLSNETIDRNNTTLDPLKVVMNREDLFKAAWREFINSPIIGIGPLGFQIKYGRYVHNIVLEVLCDYGIIGTLIIFGVIFNRINYLVKLAKKRESISIMMMLLFSLNIPLLMSSSIFLWTPFWFFLGYTSIINNFSGLNKYKRQKECYRKI